MFDLALRRGLSMIFDQVYADLAYGGPVVFPQALDGGRQCSLVVDSLSKTFGMTGWRLGYLAAPSILARQRHKRVYARLRRAMAVRR